MAELNETDVAHEENPPDEHVIGFKNDGSFLEQFRRLQEQKKSAIDAVKQQQEPASPAPIKIHVRALKKPTVRVLAKKNQEVKKAFDGDEEEPNTGALIGVLALLLLRNVFA